MTAQSYAHVLRRPHAARTFATALLGRLSYGITPLALLLTLTSTFSFAAAGAIDALYAAVATLLIPARARLLDDLGLRRALPPLVLVHSGALILLALAHDRPLLGGGGRGEAGVPWLILTVLVAAASAPPLGPTMRALWAELVADQQQLRSAYGLDTVAEEVLFAVGPLVAGGVAAVAEPAMGLAVSAVLMLVGGLALAFGPAVPASPAGPAGPATDPARRGARIRWCALRAPITGALAVGWLLGGTSLLMVAFAGRHGAPAEAALAGAALSVGSALGGLAYGRIRPRSLPGLVAATAAALAVAGLSPGVAVLIPAAFLVGSGISPALSTAYLDAHAATDPGAQIRAGAWVNTAVNAGATLGTALAGTALNTLPLPVCFAAVALPPLLLSPLSRSRPPRPAEKR